MSINSNKKTKTIKAIKNNKHHLKQYSTTTIKTKTMIINLKQ